MDETIAFIDRLDTLECVERQGVIRSLTRKARVVFGEEEIPDDYQALMQALEAAGIPVKYSSLEGDGCEMLILTERSVKIVDEDKGFFDVTLSYNHVLDSDCQIIGNGSIVYGRMRGNLHQITTNQYIDSSDPDNIHKKPIIVEHQFKPWSGLWETNNSNPDLLDVENDTEHPGVVFVQGGEVHVSVPQRNYHVVGIIRTAVPNEIQDAIHGKLNVYGMFPRDLTNTDAKGTWLCQECGYEILMSDVYKFTFEFQENKDGWNPTAVFEDERTKRPPPGLYPDVGFKTVQEYLYADFEDILNCQFEDFGA